jgi:hypothetical protein
VEERCLQRACSGVDLERLGEEACVVGAPRNAFLRTRCRPAPPDAGAYARQAVGSSQTRSSTSTPSHEPGRGSRGRRHGPDQLASARNAFTSAANSPWC